MDNRETEKYYTLNEFTEMMEPVYRKQKNIIHQCLSGLTAYAAELAAGGQTDARLRELADILPEFWVLREDVDYLAAFDQAVSEAKCSGHAPALGEQAKADILTGLELYAQEMRVVAPDLEPKAVECDLLANELRERWQSASAQQTAKPDCQLIGENGNIFNLIGIASRTLRQCGLDAQAEEMRYRIMGGECHDYYEALNVIGEYVNITGPEESGIEMGGMGL